MRLELQRHSEILILKKVLVMIIFSSLNCQNILDNSICMIIYKYRKSFWIGILNFIMVWNIYANMIELWWSGLNAANLYLQNFSSQNCVWTESFTRLHYANFFYNELEVCLKGFTRLSYFSAIRRWGKHSPSGSWKSISITSSQYTTTNSGTEHSSWNSRES